METNTMTVERLERVMARLRQRHPGINAPKYTELMMCIMKDLGTDPRTYWANKRALLKLGWIKSYTKKRFRLTNVDLTDI